jgi:hypothetical protein
MGLMLVGIAVLGLFAFETWVASRRGREARGEETAVSNGAPPDVEPELL